MLRLRTAWAVALLLLCITVYAQNTDAPDLRSRAEGLLQHVRDAVREGELGEATARAEALLLGLREAAPLRVRRALLVAGPPTGLGVYEPLPGGIVRDRQAFLYVEVEGFHRRPTTGDASVVSLTVSGDFFLEDGTPLGNRPLGTHTYVTHTPHGLTYFGPQLQLSARAPAGTYQVEVQVRDDVSGKTANARVRLLLP